jgi:hypothetical protein
LDGRLRGAERVGLRVEGVQDVEVVGEVGEVGVDGLVEGEVEGEGGRWVGGVGRVEGGSVHGESRLCKVTDMSISLISWRQPNMHVRTVDRF